MADETLNDLFGDSDDDSDDFQPASHPTKPFPSGAQADSGGGFAGLEGEDQQPAAEASPRGVNDYSDEDDELGGEERPRLATGPPLELEAPLLPLPAIRDLRLVRLSNILGIQPKEYTPENLLEEQETMEDEEGNVTSSFKNHMTIRWRRRTLPDGSVVKESNSRFVRWSDGSMQLLVGEEVLDVAEHDISMDRNYLFVRHAGPNVIQGQGQLLKKMAFRPASLSSRFHRRLTAAVEKKHKKVQKVQKVTTVADPNKEKAERERAEEQRIRDRESLQRRQDRLMKRYPTARREYGATTGLSAQYLEAIGEEPDYGEEEDDMTATERARSTLTRDRHVEEAEEREAEARLARAKKDIPSQGKPAAAKRQREEDDAMRDFLVDDDDEEEIGAKAPKRGRLVLSDDDE